MCLLGRLLRVIPVLRRSVSVGVREIEWVVGIRWWFSPCPWSSITGGGRMNLLVMFVFVWCC